MRATGRRAVALALALGALGLPSSAAADWPLYGHDLANSRNAALEGPSPSQVGSLSQAWAFKSSTGDFTGTPVIADGVLVAGNNGGWGSPPHALTRKGIWSQKLGQPLYRTAAVAPNASGGAAAYFPVAH